MLNTYYFFRMRIVFLIIGKRLRDERKNESLAVENILINFQCLGMIFRKDDDFFVLVDRKKKRC